MANGVVVFDPDEFKTLFPEFSDISNETLTFYFGLAELILNNTPSSIVCNEKDRKKLLYLLTVHIAFLNKRGMDVVGTISSATEGSVSTGFTVFGNLRSNWFDQSQYGKLFWLAIKPYMMGRYFDGC